MRACIVSLADPAIADKKEKPIINTPRDALPHLFVKSNKLAVLLLEPFRHASELATVDEDELMALKSKAAGIHAMLLETMTPADSPSVTSKLWLAELGDLLVKLVEDVLEELNAARSAQLEELKLDLLSLGRKTGNRCSSPGGGRAARRCCA